MGESMSSPNLSASSARPSVDAPIRLAIDVSPTSESHFFVGLTGDLSQGGLFVATYRDLAVGTPVIVACRLGDDEGEDEVLLFGLVAWQRDAGEGAFPGIGVRFGDLSGPRLAVVERFCRARAPLFYEVDLVAA